MCASLHLRPLAAGLNLGCVLLSVALGAEADLLRPVELFGTGSERRDLPSAEIGGDTRAVLVGFPEGNAFVRSIRPESGGTLVRADLRGALAAAKRVIVMPTFSFRGRATALPPISAEVEHDAVGAYVDLRLGFKVVDERQITLRARVQPDSLTQSHETKRVEVPKRALLEIGFGLLDTGSQPGTAEFEVLACASEGCETLFSTRLTQEKGAWRDRELPLDAFAGRQVSFRFTASSEKKAGIPSFPVWASPALYAPSPGAEGEYNVLMISADTLRADHLGAYGYPRDTSPFIDEVLAGGGSVFERCFTTATTTGPSHMSMFTGLEPSRHAVHGFYGVLAADVTTLASSFQAHGFATAAFTDVGPLGAQHGFHRGFDSYEENKSHSVASGSEHLRRTFDRGLRWLRRNRDKRFFLFLHSFAVHTPYDAPPGYQRLFADDQLDEHAPEVPDEWRPVLYDREIRHLDDELKRFFVGLEEEGLLEDTLVVFLSDHGEEFGEHGRLHHGGGIYDEVLRVPLILTGPGVPKRRVEAPVSLLDFMSTILELAGVPAPSSARGASFAALLRDESAPRKAVDEQPIFSEAWRTKVIQLVGPRKVEHVSIDVPILVAQIGAQKIIRYPGSEGPIYAYFDLAVDPLEQVDRYDASNERVRSLKRAIDDYAERMAAARKSPASENKPEGLERLDPDQIQKLRALGYIE
jgi:hypothetical protein